MADRHTDAELYQLALSLAEYAGESAEVAALRAFVHGEMMAERIVPPTFDRIGELLDAITASQRSKVGDYIGGTDGIPWDVLELVDDDGDRWRRIFGEDRYDREDDGTVDRSYDLAGGATGRR